MKPHTPERVTFAGLALDFGARTLTDASGNGLVLTPSEFGLLAAFVHGAGRALSREHLLQAVAGREARTRPAGSSRRAGQGGRGRRRQALAAARRTRRAAAGAGAHTPKALAARLRIAPQTGTALLRALQGRGVVREVTGRGSFRAFAI